MPLKGATAGEKRKRRAASPSQKGLNAGEKLNRNRLLVESDIRWNWIGTDVKHTQDITQYYRLRAAGLIPSKTRHICPNKFARRANGLREHEKKEVNVGENPDDVIVISDEEDEPTCEKKQCKDNPFCLNYLKQDKWEDEEAALQTFLDANIKASNPETHARKRNLPVGLRNLGATCYANAFLQVWFQDLAFRSGVYKCQPLASNARQFKDSPIFQLQVTFAALQMGAENVFNPVKLVESLRLKTSEQQDAQEFSKLFMSHLDEEFKKQTNSDLKSLLPSQFQGTMVHATVCNQCKTCSERESPFLELEINLQKDSTLEDRIASILAPEMLTDDNKYLCSNCETLQDATRYTKIRSLPPVLHISLLRFVFDLAVNERRKSKLALKIPPYLNMKPFVHTSDPDRMESTDGDEEIYELRGVLLHKGQSAYHGHYEAQVYSQTTGKWYQFNDEVVTPLASLHTPKVGKNIYAQDTDGLNGDRPAKRQKRVAKSRRVEDSDNDETQRMTPSDKALPTRYLSSKDAYMLIYARRETKNAVSESQLAPPPEALDIVQSRNKEYEKSCEEYRAMRDRMREEFIQKRAIVMDIYQTWNISSTSEPCSVVSRSALGGWISHWLSPAESPSQDEKKNAIGNNRSNSIAEGSAPPEEDYGGKSDLTDDVFPEYLFNANRSSSIATLTAASSDIIDNSVLLCPHGYLNPLSDKEMKLISTSAREKIAQCGFTFKPNLTVDNICSDCVNAEFLEKLYQIQHPQLVAQFNQICSVESETEGYWISKPWLKDWQLNRPKMHKSSCGDPPPDGSDFYHNVKCEHDCLTLNLSCRRRISYEAVKLLQDLYPTWQPPAWDAELCPACETQVHLSKESRLEQRKKAEHEKALLPRLLEADVFERSALTKGFPCAALPVEFIREWRTWIQKPGDAQRPDGVDNSYLICEHGKLNVNLSDAGDIDANIAIVSMDEWNTISTFYIAGPLISVAIATDISDGIEKEDLHTSIPCCVDCRSKARLDFTSTMLTVVFLKGNEEIPSSPAAFQLKCNEASSQPNGNGMAHTRGDGVSSYFGRLNGTRQSRRLKDGRYRKRSVVVFKKTTIKDIKVNIQKILNVPTVSQRLFYRRKELENNADTVEKLQILDRDVLYLKEVDEDAIALDSDSDEVSKPIKKRDEGNAFRGTLLSSSFPAGTSTTSEDGQSQRSSDAIPAMKACLTCTFDNEPDSIECSMCSHPLPVD